MTLESFLMQLGYVLFILDSTFKCTLGLVSITFKKKNKTNSKTTFTHGTPNLVATVAATAVPYNS